MESGFMGGEWSAPDCQTVENESFPIVFSAFAAEDACSYSLRVPVTVDRFDPRAYCESTCAYNDSCNRVVEGDCYDDCIDAIRAAPADESMSCHYAIRDAYDCMYGSPCSVKGGFEDRCLLELNDSAFIERDCAPPAIPAGLADPRACNPALADLRAGLPGDFATISITTDYPGQYYFILDLSQLAGVDDAIAANSGSLSLQLAAAVVSDLRAMDQGEDDACDEPVRLAIVFDPPFDPSELGRIDDLLGDLQDLIVAVDAAVDTAKEAAAAELMSFYCDLLTEILGDILGYLAQVQQGCFD
jgi:hypothetical protein